MIQYLNVCLIGEVISGETSRGITNFIIAFDGTFMYSLCFLLSCSTVVNSVALSRILDLAVDYNEAVTLAQLQTTWRKIDSIVMRALLCLVLCLCALVSALN